MIALLTQILLHELGHLGGVYAVGYGRRPWRLAVGPVQVTRAASCLEVAVRRDGPLGLAGYVTFSATDASRVRRLVVTAAGPSATLLAVAVLWALSHAQDAPARPLTIQLTVAAILFAGCLLPLPRVQGGWATDGRRILDLLRRGSSVDAG